MTDEQLIHGCVEGNAVAQKLLYDTYSRKMMGVCLRYASDYEEAQDILQDGFVKVYQKLGSFQHKGSLEGWIRRTVVNTALDNFRRNKQHRHQVELGAVDYLLEADDNVLSSLAAKDLLKIIQKLPSGYRTVFNLFAIEGYSHKEIADQLEISENTSKSQFRKAKAYLQRFLPKEKAIR